MTEKTYYILTVFRDKERFGKTLKNEYKREVNAERKLKELAESGAYELIVMRKEENCGSGISISSPYKRWEATK